MASDNSQLRFFAKFIEEQIGIIYSETNYFQLEHRLNEIVGILGLSSLDELWSKAKDGIDFELQNLLLDIATNNETSFFRDAALFEALTQNIVPELRKVNPQLSPVRVWSAAGSTGQEAYSLAICMDQARRKDSSFPDFEIFVSDVSERVLARAKEGKYSQLEVQRGLNESLLKEYFELATETIWQVKSSIRQKLNFKKMNLLEPFIASLGMYDVIFCRNVLIYQSVENKVKVVEKLLHHLTPGGFLALGAAESMLGVSNAVTQCQYGSAVVYRKN